MRVWNWPVLPVIPCVMTLVFLLTKMLIRFLVAVALILVDFHAILIRCRVALCRAAVPPCVVSPHGVAAGLQGMAAVELERLGVALRLAPQSGESLYRRGRRLRQQLRNVAASAHAAHRSIKRFAKTMQQADADEGRIRWRDFIAGAGVRHLVRLHL